MKELRFYIIQKFCDHPNLKAKILSLYGELSIKEGRSGIDMPELIDKCKSDINQLIQQQ